MPKLRLSVSVFLTILGIILNAPSMAVDRVTCIATWDSFFFYAAIEVQDPDVVSTNTKHMSNPWEDDDIEVFLETDFKRAPNRTRNTFQMAVSAGGGSSFVVGEDGQPKPKTIYTFKFAKKIHGTLNQPIDRDTGYTVELAIPWKEMGGPPEPGQVMSFNLICRMRGENTGFVSLSPNVKTEDDVHVPAKWGSIKFVNMPTIIARQDGTVMCRKVVSRPPIIDGVLSRGEWNMDLSFQLTKPKPPAVKPGQQYLIERLSLTHYFYWYQGDERKEAPFGHVRYEDGSSALTDHPLKGVGPWFSHDRVQWHKEELSDIRYANIDVIIPVYWGSAANRRQFALKGLDCMVQALKELKAEGKDYPLVGMFFDTSAMWVQYGKKPDLRDDEVKQTFYGMIKDFFLHVPDEFRAVVQLPTEKGGRPAYIVVLYTASWFSDLDGGFVEYCNSRFAEDFGGARLVWVGHSDFRPKADVMDGYSNYGAGLGLQFDDTGWIDIVGVGAGYDDSAVRGRTTPIRSRMAGDVYKDDWRAAAGKRPNWVIVDGWNELHEGSEICATRQYGVRYVGLTKINMLRFNEMRPYDAKFVKHDVPKAVYPGAIHQVTLTIRNAGTKPWYAREGFFLSCRWYKDGALFADTTARLPLQDTVLAGRTVVKTIGVRAVGRDGKPLPEGDYELRFEMVRGRDEWFTGGGDMPLIVPVKVSAAREPAFTLVGSTAATLMKSGAAYSVNLKLRNDGPTPWEASAVRIGYRWYKVSVHLGSDTEDSSELMAVNEAAGSIPSDVKPGRVVEVVVHVSVVGRDGSPLPVWTQNDLWTYVLKWDVFDGEKWLAGPGIGSAAESVTVTRTDYGPRFIQSDTPQEMSAGKEYTVSLALENTGTDVWTAADFKVGYHWYYLDGMEAVWDGAKSPLPSDVHPGERVLLKASVTSPPFDSQYYLVWDLAHGDTWASTTANTRGGDILVVPVNVIKGRLVAQDLDKLFDTDTISWDIAREDGDFDGTGLSYPAEFLPPETSLLRAARSLWPCGLWTSVQGSGLGSSRHISFEYPPKADGANNAVTCKGQSIRLKSGRYMAIHVLAAASQETSGEFGLVYGSKTVPITVQFSAWDKAPRHGEHAAFVCLHRHSPDGDQRGRPCYLNHYTISADASSKLNALRLPNNEAIKVLAVTLEKPE